MAKYINRVAFSAEDHLVFDGKVSTAGTTTSTSSVIDARDYRHHTFILTGPVASTGVGTLSVLVGTSTTGTFYTADSLITSAGSDSPAKSLVRKVANVGYAQMATLDSYVPYIKVKLDKNYQGTFSVLVFSRN